MWTTKESVYFPDYPARPRAIEERVRNKVHPSVRVGGNDCDEDNSRGMQTKLVYRAESKSEQFPFPVFWLVDGGGGTVLN